MTDSVTGRDVEPTWRLSGAIAVGLLLLLTLIAELFVDFKVRELLLPLYLTPFQRSQLLVLLFAPIQIGAAGYLAMRVGKVYGISALLQSVDWNPSGSLAIPAVIGFGLAGLMTVSIFGKAASQFDGYAPLSVLLFVLCTVLYQPFIEELYYRGILFSAVTGRMGVIAAVVLTSLLFAWFHPLHRLTILPIALLLGGTRMKTRSVASCFAQHVAYNLGIWLFQFVYWR